MRRTMLGLCLLAGGCASLGDAGDRQRPTPVFSAERFFTGQSRGEGRLKILFKPAQPVTVESRGRVGDDGMLVLDQTIRQGAQPPRTRRWQIRAIGAGRYVGTLTDATGPVAGDVTGNRLHLRFRAKGGLDTEQWLFLDPDGRVAHNRMVVRKLGITVATLDEIIRKDGSEAVHQR